MAYQRKKRSQEQAQSPIPTEQSSLFASPELDVADAEDALSDTVTDDTATLELRRKQANQSGFDFGSVPIFPADQANPLPIQRQPWPLRLQPQLTVGPVGDKYEQEADRVADQVVNTINSSGASTPDANPSVQRDISEQPGEQDTLQKSSVDPIQRIESNASEDLQMEPTAQRVGKEGGAVSTDLARDIQGTKGSGQALDPNLQQSIGQAMGADFSGVKIHTDAQSDQLNQSIQAKAFTTGQDVFFRQGEYNPGSKDGQRLIAHELTHVVQQNGPSMSRTEPSIQTKPVTISQSSHGSLIQRDMSIFHAASKGYRPYYDAYKKIKKEFPINFMKEIIVPEYDSTYNQDLDNDKTLEKKGIKAIGRIMQDEEAYPSDELADDVMDLAPTLVAEKKDSIIEDPKKLAKNEGGKIIRKFARQFLNEHLNGAVYNSLQSTKIKTRKSKNDEEIPDETLKKFKARISKEVETVLEKTWEEKKHIYDAQITQEMEAFNKEKFLIKEVKNQAKKVGDKEYKKLENSNVLKNIENELAEKRLNYKIDILLDIRLALEKMLPISKTKLLENDDNKELRQHVKDKAREFTQNKISKAIAEQADAKKMPATYKYLKMKAGKKGYKDAKGAANKVLADLARTGATQAYEDKDIDFLMEQTVRRAAWSKLRNEEQPSKHKTTATKHAVKQLDKLFKEHKKNAKTYASEWKKQYIDDFQQKPATKTKLNKKTKKQVKDLGKTIVSEITAESPEHSMSILSTLIDTFVPEPGDQASLNVEFKIPIPNSPAYILLGIKGTAARGLNGVVNAAPELDADNNDRVEVRGDFTFGAGAQFLGAEADGSLGVFLRAGAADSIKAAQAMSYGLYRFLAKKSKRMAGWWAGAGDSSTNMNKEERAETWAAMVEEQVFKGGGVVDTGAGIRGRAKAGITENAELGASIGGAYFTRYDKKSIGAQLGQSPKNPAAATKRRKDIRGQGFWAFSAKLTGKFPAFVTGAGASLSYTAAWSKGKLKTWELSLSGDLGIDNSDEISRIATQAGLGLAKAIRKIKSLLNEKKSESDNSDKLRNASSALAAIESGIKAAVGPEIEDKLGSLYEFEEPESKTVTGDTISPAKIKKGIAPTKKVRLKLAVGLSGGKRVIRVALYEVSTTKAKIPGLGGVTYEKSRRVGSGGLGYELVKEYKLNLVRVKKTADIPTNIPEGNGLVYAAKFKGTYHIRIFDKSGKAVASKALPAKDSLISKLDEALKDDNMNSSKENSLKKEIVSYLGYSAEKKSNFTVV